MSTLWNMADFPFDMLHSEVVRHYLYSRGTNDLSAMKTVENMGFRVGYAFAERISKEFPRLCSELDAVKFVCKDFWLCVFQKQVDNLKTNHQGVYVVHEKSFRLLEAWSSGEQHKTDAPNFVVFSCGIIRGALRNLGFVVSVIAEIGLLPAVKFTITVPKS